MKIGGIDKLKVEIDEWPICRFILACQVDLMMANLVC